MRLIEGIALAAWAVALLGFPQFGNRKLRRKPDCVVCDDLGCEFCKRVDS